MAEAQKAATKKKEPKAPALAPGRVKKLILKDEEIGRMAAGAPVALAAAGEEYIREAVRLAGRLAEGREDATVNVDHLRVALQSDPERWKAILECATGGEGRQTRRGRERRLCLPDWAQVKAGMRESPKGHVGERWGKTRRQSANPRE